MKFIAFNGSPAGVNSATNRIIEAFLNGAKRGGAQVENYQLSEYKINQCQGCFACWFQSPGKCVMHDDMEKLLRAYQSADVVCFGSPVYSWNMTALLKNFVDRLVPLKSPLITQSEGNFDMIDSEKRVQKYVAISNCGFPGENNFAIIKAAFSCCNPSLEIYRNCGKLLKTKKESVQEVVAEYLNVVEQAGYEMATVGEVCETTQEQLSMPLMTIQEYVQFLGM
ncbi:flavodoxin family protein [Anaerosporobacter sp.]|uniref:flavodoxin family protein n=1 Tax=Anaerosporobacter sp. TaxID=1872529 RepID=UPI00286EBAEF|nr:flavodoxin family protein [Anaerosporobacter sp.]